MKKLFASILAIVAIGVGLASPAVAAPERASSVGAITCLTEDSCVLDFVGNGGNGYWMARLESGTTWVRLTLVPGWSTTNIAPITCKYEDSCVLDWYSNHDGIQNDYWMARQSSGTTWVRLTLVNGAKMVSDAGAPATAMSSTRASATAPVWCGTPSVCIKDYVYPTADHQGYWMIKRFYEGERWWRATLVAGWNNTYVAPITCENAGACVVVYYDAYQTSGYYMARRWNDYDGSHWVRLTEI